MNVNAPRFQDMTTAQKAAIITGAAVGVAAVATTVAAGIKGRKIVNTDEFVNKYKQNHNGKDLGKVTKFFQSIKEGFKSIGASIQATIAKIGKKAESSNGGEAQ